MIFETVLITLAWFYTNLLYDTPETLNHLPITESGIKSAFHHPEEFETKISGVPAISLPPPAMRKYCIEFMLVNLSFRRKPIALRFSGRY